MVYSRIKSVLQAKISFTKTFEGVTAQLLNKLNHLQERLNFLINRSKQNYYARITKKITNVSKNCKTYWSLWASFKQQKILLIPPLFYENQFVTDFKEKAELFNSQFSTQCPLISNSYKLQSHIQYLTDNRLSCVSFCDDKTVKLI